MYKSLRRDNILFFLNSDRKNILFIPSITNPSAAASPNFLDLSQQLKLHVTGDRWYMTLRVSRMRDFHWIGLMPNQSKICDIRVCFIFFSAIWKDPESHGREISGKIVYCSIWKKEKTYFLGLNVFYDD